MSSLEDRVQVLESALGLPGEVAGAAGAGAAAEISRLKDKVDELQKALDKANYRIAHLVRSVDEAKKDEWTK